MFRVEELMKWSVQAEIKGQWVAGRPLRGPFLSRLKDAWAVLTGKADAVRWPLGQ